jgi:hypothetical protein
MNLLVLILIVLVPFWFLQNIIHELAHGLAIRIGWGWKFSIWPFPSKKLGRFTFAHVIYEPTAASQTPTNKGWALISIMPRIVNSGLILISTTLSDILVSVSPVAAVLCALFAACNLVDFSVGMAGIFRNEPNQSDIWRFQTYMEFDVFKLRWLAAFSILFGWALLAVPVGFLFGV